MLTIGLDVHQSKTNVCVLDAKGNTLRQQEVKGDYGAVAEALSKVKQPFQVCYEASTGYGALYERLVPVATVRSGRPRPPDTQRVSSVRLVAPRSSADRDSSRGRSRGLRPMSRRPQSGRCSS